MSQRPKNLEYKTLAFIGLSTVLHAGLIIYVAASHYGSNSPTATPASSGDSVVVDFTPTTPAATPTPSAPAPTPAPKKVTEVKALALPAKSQANIVKSEEKLAAPIVSETPESVPVPVAMAEIAPSPEQQLAEQIKNDVVTPETEPVADATTEASAVVPDSVPVETTVPAIVEKSSPMPAGNSNIVGESAAIAMPIRQDSELKAMPGNQDPNYAFDDRLAKREGEIKFLAEVTPEGLVTNVRMLKSTGHKSLDMAALKSFKSYRYQPGQQGYVLKSFNFVLKGPARQLPSRLADRATTSVAK